MTMTIEETDTQTTPGVRIVLTTKDANRLLNTLQNIETIMFAAFRDNALLPYAENPLHLAEQIAALHDLLQGNSADCPVPADTPTTPHIPRQPGMLDPHTHYTVFQEIGQQDPDAPTGRFIWERIGELQLTPAQFNCYDIPRTRNDTQLGIQTRCRLLLMSSTGKIIRDRYSV